MTTFDTQNRSPGKLIVFCSLFFISSIILAGCATRQNNSGHPAPIVEQGAEMGIPTPKAAAPETSVQPKKNIATINYVVQKGDTLYSIAFLHGIDSRELAELNHIDKPDEIHIGQQLRVPAPPAKKTFENKPLLPLLPPPSATTGGLKTQPKVGKVPYSENAFALAEAMQGDAQKVVSVNITRKEAAALKEADDEDALEWGMPTTGKVIAEFSETDSRKGMDIAGRRGQVVVASAAGKVVYSGSGLRGYGKLVIVKHNKTYLSAYAHNDQVFVKEGQNVTKGQKIAEMGDSDSDQVALHFEIRKLGTPVDPALYLPLLKQ